MKIVNLILLLTITALSSVSTANVGGWSSGGGTGVVCFKSEATASAVREKSGLITDEMLGEIDSIEVLDVHEARKSIAQFDAFYEARLAEPRAGESADSFAMRALERFRNNIGFNAADGRSDIGQRLLRTYLDMSLNNGRVLLVPQDSSLVYLKDEGLTFEERHETSAKFQNGRCALVPLAVQETTPTLVRIVIDSRLYDHPAHSTLSRAALLLHELVYQDARNRGQADSRKTRQFVGILLENAKDLYHTGTIQRVCRLGFLDISPSECDQGGALLDFAVRIRALAEATHAVAGTLAGAICRNFGGEFKDGSLTEALLVQQAKDELKSSLSASELRSIANANQAFYFLSRKRPSSALVARLDHLIRARSQRVQLEVIVRSETYLSGVLKDKISAEHMRVINEVIRSISDKEIAELLDRRQSAMSVRSADKIIDPEQLGCRSGAESLAVSKEQARAWAEALVKIRALPIYRKFLYPVL